MDGIPPLGMRWTHSHEEDHDGVRVYRLHGSYAFQPSRAGRDTLLFQANGELTIQSPGPDDRPTDSARCWSALGDGKLGIGGMPGAPEEIVEVVECGPDILTLRPL